MRPLLALSLFASVALADVGLLNGGTVLGPVRDLDCQRDAGLTCLADAGVRVGKLRCNEATATEPGCVTPSAQSFAGNKTLATGYLRVVGVAHASLTACAAGTKGMWQTCTTHNAPVFCNGTSNLELGGTSAAEKVLAAVYVNGVPTLSPLGQFTQYGEVTLSSGGSWVTMNAIAGDWYAGTGSGSLTFRVHDGSNNCDCAIDCDVPLARSTCSGNCAFAASATVAIFVLSSACTTAPVAIGNLHLMGVTQ
jgi:hypothetical protein